MASCFSFCGSFEQDAASVASSKAASVVDPYRRRIIRSLLNPSFPSCPTAQRSAKPKWPERGFQAAAGSRRYLPEIARNSGHLGASGRFLAHSMVLDGRRPAALSTGPERMPTTFSHLIAGFFEGVLASRRHDKHVS